MKNQIILRCGLCVALALPAGTALAQQPNNAQSRRGYATDYFEGFDAVDKDQRIPQKEKSFWFSVSADTPKAQLEYARGREKAGELNSARKGYEALVRQWPTSPEAVEAQYSIAKVQEKRGKYSDAFDQYQYMLVHYAGNCPYYEVLDREYRVANYLLHNNTSMFGWALSGLSSVREKFEQIIRNAPRSPIAPEVMLTIGGIREADGEPKEAIQVYDGLLNRFPTTPQAERAAYLTAKCRHDLAMKYSDNEARCREAISFYKALLERRPNHPQKADLLVWQKDLQNLLVEQNYNNAVFYDSRQRSLEASKMAYKRFLSEFGDSKYAPQVKARLKALESGAAPLK
jgi:outer membrane protein assembly factor BamD